MYVLRRVFGISALEARHGMPLWERQVLLERLAKEQEGAKEPEQDYSKVPEDAAR